MMMSLMTMVCILFGHRVKWWNAAPTWYLVVRGNIGILAEPSSRAPSKPCRYSLHTNEALSQFSHWANLSKDQMVEKIFELKAITHINIYDFSPIRNSTVFLLFYSTVVLLSSFHNIVQWVFREGICGLIGRQWSKLPSRVIIISISEPLLWGTAEITTCGGVTPPPRTHCCLQEDDDHPHCDDDHHHHDNLQQLASP